jgi:very-short-patch-repair endonuclease
MSKGEDALGELLRQTFPHHVLIAQHPIKIGRQTLYVDYYIPALCLAFEFDGVQHSKYVGRFHGNLQGFAHSQNNDDAKDEWLSDKGIHLIRFKYNESVNQFTLASKIKDATN